MGLPASPRLGPRCKRSFGDQPASVIAHAKKASSAEEVRGQEEHRRRSAIARELCGFIWALMVKEAA